MSRMFLKDNYIFHVITFWRNHTLEINRIEILDFYFEMSTKFYFSIIQILFQNSDIIQM